MSRAKAAVPAAWQNKITRYAKQMDAEGHTTAKPLDVVNDLLAHTEGLVYDPFVGSGTTLIAAEQLGRRCYAMEIDSGYCDVVVRRWETVTGRKAERG